MRRHGRSSAIAQELSRGAASGRPTVGQRHTLAVLNGIVLTGSARAQRSATTLYHRLKHWRVTGGCDRLLAALTGAYGGDIVMIDNSCINVHQHGAVGKKGDLPIFP